MEEKAKAAASPEPSEDTQTTAKEAKSAPVSESVYSVDELTRAAETLCATPDIVKTALRMKGVTETTVSEAKRIVAKFKKREVQ